MTKKQIDRTLLAYIQQALVETIMQSISTEEGFGDDFDAISELLDCSSSDLAEYERKLKRKGWNVK